MSKSLRVTDALFESATEVADLFSRSAAQQIEYWAKIGKAVEAAGLTAESVISLLSSEGRQNESALWRHKRELQDRDMSMLSRGIAKQEDMYLFSADIVKSAQVLNGPY
jgi:hypothetical protein